MKPVSVYYCIGVLALSLIPLGASQAQAVELVRIIDNFNASQVASGTGSLPPSNNVLINSPLLGNNINRNLSGSVNSNPFSATLSVAVNSLTGVVIVDNGSFMTSSVKMTYGNLPTFPVVNFTQDGATQIAFNVLFNDVKTGIIFDFTDADGTVGNIPFQLPGGIFAPVRFSSPFTSAISSGGTTPGLDFTKITAFNFRVDNTLPGTTPGADVVIDFIATAKTPEPSSVLGLSALGLLGLMTRKKKKKES